MIARNDVSVQFDGNAIRLHLQLLYQTGEGEGRIKNLSFAVDYEIHRSRFSQGECLQGKFGSFLW